jgi:hypothetical protein
MLVGAGTVDTPAEGSYAYFIYYIAALAERTKAEIVSVSVEMTSANPQEVRNTPHLHRFIVQNDHFAKTGSGQTLRKCSQNQVVVFAGALPQIDWWCTADLWWEAALRRGIRTVVINKGVDTVFFFSFPFFSILQPRFHVESDDFTKTGSGHTQKQVILYLYKLRTSISLYKATQKTAL